MRQGRDKNEPAGAPGSHVPRQHPAIDFIMAFEYLRDGEQVVTLAVLGNAGDPEGVDWQVRLDRLADQRAHGRGRHRFGCEGTTEGGPQEG